MAKSCYDLANFLKRFSRPGGYPIRSSRASGAGSSVAPRHPGGRDDAHRELEREAGSAADAGLQVVVRDAHDVVPLRQDLPSSASSATVQSILETLPHVRLRNDHFVKLHGCT